MNDFRKTVAVRETIAFWERSVFFTRGLLNRSNAYTWMPHETRSPRLCYR